MRIAWKVLKALFFLCVLLFLAAQLFRPSRANPPVDESQAIQAGTQMTPEVAAIFEHSCRDCHSNKTVWPWYTNVAPISWFITNHVNEGRHSMNLSEWGRKDQRGQGKKLEQMCDEVKDGAMPLSSYTPLHPGSKPSADDIKTLCDWTEAERARLASQ